MNDQYRDYGSEYVRKMRSEPKSIDELLRKTQEAIDVVLRGIGMLPHDRSLELEYRSLLKKESSLIAEKAEEERPAIDITGGMESSEYVRKMRDDAYS